MQVLKINKKLKSYISNMPDDDLRNSYFIIKNTYCELDYYLLKALRKEMILRKFIRDIVELDLDLDD